ncbi:MAG: TIGR02530 family flagellar biosynthesis protein [Thermotaleaceae bacterium]
MNKIIPSVGRTLENKSLSTIHSRGKELKSFSQILDQVVENQELKFSKHALLRLEARNIQLNTGEVQKIKEALNKAQQKGIRETLIIMDEKTFVASVKNKTIITAATKDMLEDNVFTNIDGAVII